MLPLHFKNLLHMVLFLRVINSFFVNMENDKRVYTHFLHILLKWIIQSHFLSRIIFIMSLVQLNKLFF